MRFSLAMKPDSLSHTDGRT